MRRSLAKGIAAGGLLIVLALPGVQAQPHAISRAEYVEAYQARCDSLIRYYAHRLDAATDARAGFFDLAARLTLGHDLDGVLTRLDSLLSRPPRGDMF